MIRTHNTILTCLVLFAVLLTTCITYPNLLGAPRDFWQTRSRSSSALITALPLSPTVKRLFDQVWSDSPSPLVLHEVQALCARTEFRDTLYLQCNPAFAGLTTIMSQVKVCIRMALETGSHLVMPVMAMRDNTNLKDFRFDRQEAQLPFGEWFEEDTMIARLREACPQIQVVRSEDAVVSHAQHLMLDLATAPYFNGIGNYAWPGRDWAAWFRQESERLVNASAPSSSGVVVIRTPAPLSFFNVIRDPSGRSLALWNELNYLMRFKAEPRRILHSILTALSDSHGHLRPFYGVHFRTESDSPEAWSTADVQIRRILNTAEEAWKMYAHGPGSVKLMYIACGDTDRIAQFKAAANTHGWDVVDKYHLTQSINATLHQQLLSLPFDHQGMVDLSMMLVSHFYVGLTNSAFSFTIAHARDPRGRYGGSSLLYAFDQDSWLAKTHLFDDGEGAYPCCL